MAFRQPTYHAPQRIYTPPDLTQVQAQPVAQPTTQPQHLADSQEWILFSPAAESTTDRTYTTSTARTRTAGRSRISDFGSLDTAARSYGYDDDDAVAEEALEEEEDGELDSLDSHLHEFREPSLYRQSAEASGTVLPTHDGLGSFRLDQIGMGEEVQEHLYAFERFNPRRVKRRRESVEMGMLELESERAAEAERTRRIETWRMEQSRVLVEEIQRETRRRKQSMSTQRESFLVDREQEDVATLSNVDIGTEQDEVPGDENESFWNRITRRVIRDLMRIDDDLLSIIFGEALPEDDLSTTPPADAARSVIVTNRYDQSSWEFRLLERIARELGILASQISDHPGAFSTYLHSQQTPLPYAGLPVIPECRPGRSGCPDLCQRTPERGTGVRFMVEIAGLDVDVACSVVLDRVVQRIGHRAAPGPLPGQSRRGPVGPVAPVGPVGPAGPLAPAGPVAPAGPIASNRSTAAPAGPAGPVARFVPGTPERWTSVRFMVEIAGLDVDVACSVVLDRIVQRRRSSCRSRSLPGQSLRTSGSGRAHGSGRSCRATGSSGCLFASRTDFSRSTRRASRPGRSGCPDLCQRTPERGSGVRLIVKIAGLDVMQLVPLYSTASFSA